MSGIPVVPGGSVTPEPAGAILVVPDAILVVPGAILVVPGGYASGPQRYSGVKQPPMQPRNSSILAIPVVAGRTKIHPSSTL